MTVNEENNVKRNAILTCANGNLIGIKISEDQMNFFNWLYENDFINHAVDLEFLSDTNFEEI